MLDCRHLADTVQLRGLFEAQLAYSWLTVGCALWAAHAAAEARGGRSQEDRATEARILHVVFIHVSI